MAVINLPISDDFQLRDNSDVALTGKLAADFVTIEAYALPSGNPTALVALTEIGAGEYAITFTPTTVATWTAHVVYNSGGVFREFSQSYDVVASDAPVITSVVAVTGDSRRTMRRRVGAKLGDLLLLTATTNGSTTTFADNVHLRSANTYEGRVAFFIDGLNDGLERRVTGSSGTTLTVGPALTAATATGDVAELWNERAQGWTPTEVHDALDQTIADAATLGGIEVAATIGGTFDADTANIAIPGTLTHIYAVEYQDDEGFWKRTPKASGAGRGGYWVRAVDGVVEVQGDWRTSLDGRVVRLLGYGQPAPLTSDTSLVGCNSTWLLNAACAVLMEAGEHKVPGRERWALYYAQQADRMKAAAAKVRRPGAESVRA